jgi:hypothetical protein
VACNSEFVREIVGKRHGQKGFDELSTTNRLLQATSIVSRK